MCSFSNGSLKVADLISGDCADYIQSKDFWNFLFTTWILFYIHVLFFCWNISPWQDFSFWQPLKSHGYELSRFYQTVSKSAQYLCVCMCASVCMCMCGNWCSWCMAGWLEYLTTHTKWLLIRRPFPAQYEYASSEIGFADKSLLLIVCFWCKMYHCA